jgi:hypothetical protein
LGVENAVRLAGCSLAEAIQMVTLNPQHILAFEQAARTVFKVDPPDGKVIIVATVIAEKAVYQNPDWSG